MKGNWIGFYKYQDEKLQKAVGFEKTGFAIKIDFFEENKFSGTVTDDSETGGMRGTGTIKGEIKNSKITFVKQMPFGSTLDREGNREFTEKKHAKLYYIGTWNSDKSKIVGQWKFRYKIGFLFGFIPIPYRPGNGDWEMKRE